MPREIRKKMITIAVVLVLSILAIYPLRDTAISTATVTDVLDAEGNPILSKRKIDNEKIVNQGAYWARKLTLGVFHSLKEKFEDAEPTVINEQRVVVRERTTMLRGLTFGLDLTGGAELTYDILFDENQAGVTKLANDIKEIIERRINNKGLTEPIVQLVGNRRLLVQVPQTATQDIDEVRRTIEGTGYLEFRLVCNVEAILKKYANDKGGTPPPGYHWYFIKGREKKTGQSGDEWVLIEDGYPGGIKVTGGMLASATVEPGANQEPTVSLTFGAEGRGLFYLITSAHKETSTTPGRRLAIILDDVRIKKNPDDEIGEIVKQGRCYSAPSIKSSISGQGQITGSFNMEEAQTLATVLMAGRLPATLQLAGVNEVGPTLGEDSVISGSRAIIVGLLVVLVFMAGYYLLAGAIADFALLFNMVLLVSALAVYNATLTLPGIAGIILTVGMSVDANVLIFERIREERRRRPDKPILAVIQDGYKRAMSAIIDANVTTLFTAAILYQFGTGPIKGFALTLFLGILFSLFTALFVTRTIFEWLAMTKRISELKMFGNFKPTSLAFLKVSPKMIVGSVVVMVLSLVMIGSRGSDFLDTDFTGGTRVHVVMNEQVDVDWIRAQLDTVGLECDVQSLQARGADAKSEFLIRTPNVASPIVGRKPEQIAALLPSGDPDPHGGGRVWTVEINKPFLPADLEAELKKAGHPNPKVVPMGEPVGETEGEKQIKRLTKAKVFVKSSLESKTYQDITDAFRVLSVRGDIKKVLKDKLEEFASIITVGPSVAREMQTNALIAILLSLLVVVCYIWFRFELVYGMAAIVALVHDVGITLGVLALLDVQVNLHIVAAMLTIIGYSLNDTIVVFDRIRENLGIMRRDTYEDVVNVSINQTLPRTVLTSTTTFIAVFSLWALGGPVIHDFATALLIGVFVGTYSSVFIASPIVVFARRRDIASRRRARA